MNIQHPPPPPPKQCHCKISRYYSHQSWPYVMIMCSKTSTSFKHSTDLSRSDNQTADYQWLWYFEFKDLPKLWIFININDNNIGGKWWQMQNHYSVWKRTRDKMNFLLFYYFFLIASYYHNFYKMNFFIKKKSDISASADYFEECSTFRLVVF